MKKALKPEICKVDLSYTESRFNQDVENSKRRRALPPFPVLDEASRLFFERVVIVKQMSEFVFISKASAKRR